MLRFLISDRKEFWSMLLVRLFTQAMYVCWAFIFQVIINVALGKQQLNLLLLGSGILLFMIIMDGFGGLDNYLGSLLKLHTAQRLRQALIQRIYRLTPQAYDKFGIGKLVAKVTKQTDNVIDNYYGQLLLLLSYTFQISMAMIATITINPTITLVVIILSLPAMFFPFLLKKKLTTSSAEVVKQIDRYTARVTDLLSGFTTLKFALAGKAAVNRHRISNQKLLVKQQENARWSSFSMGISLLLSDITYISTWILGAVMVQQGRMNLGQMVVFSTLSGYLSYPLLEITRVIPLIIGGHQAAVKLADFLQYDQTASATPFLTTTTFQPTTSFKLQAVNLEADQQLILKKLNLELNLNCKYLLVGSSGSGKTTLTKLLLGEIAPSSGSATLAGQSVELLKRQTIYQQIGLLQQQGHIFSGTVRDNLNLFDNPFSETKLIAALKRAGLASWLDGHSLDTIVSNQSSLLSGGERQRLALARLFLRDYRFYIFDELTTGLDPQIAAALLHDLFSMETETGFLLITHSFNLEAFQKADQIIVLQAGKIIACGKYQDAQIKAQLATLKLGV
ncbi:MAG: ABC transporter ATP-binding protein [Liquorilactobacillus ghanensis]|uniref:ABC transporter transmembrane domain-containing protein n=1 Tax=Liquorilactobacillus ghanensis TaxID=399370 RepID=UPI0039EBB2C3